MSVKIVTDSTAYLDKGLEKMYDIKIIPMIINYKNESLKETEIDEIAFYEGLEKEGELPTTSQPSPMDIEQVFIKLLEEGHDICAIFLSADFSGTFLSAQNVKKLCLERFPDRKIEIIDSQGTCMGSVVLHGAQLAAGGGDLQSIVKSVKEKAANSSFLFIPASLDYLKKGGRIGGARYLLGSILDIKPILTIKEGRVAVVDKVRNKKKALEKMINILEKDMNCNNIEGLTVGHVNCPQDGREIATILEDKFSREVKVKSIGPVIGMHVGPGTIGIGYYKV